MTIKKRKGPGGNKGYVNLLDALLALIFFSFIFAVFIGVHEPKFTKGSTTQFKNLHYMCEDVLDVMNKQGILDDVGTEWAAANGSMASESWENAVNISRTYLDKLIPERYGYRLVIDETNVIYDSDVDPESKRPKESDSETGTHSSRLLVGYATGMPTRGHVARAFLTNIREKTTSTYAYFGGFEGQGNLTKKITLPEGTDTVQSICLEYNSGDDFILDIDGADVPVIFPRSPMNMSAVWQCVDNPEGFIASGGAGTHTFGITFTGPDYRYQYIAGGFIKVTYNTSELDTASETGVIRYDLPGIEGMMNLYSSFYVPGVLNSMNLHTKFYNNYSSYITIGDVKIFDTRENSSREFCSISDNEYTCDIPADNLSQMLTNGGLSYSADLSEKTIPLRMGVENISGSQGLGLADVILITDLSGSMEWRIGYNDAVNGVVRDCDSGSLYDDDTRRISLAKCLDKDFVNTILNTTGNRIGLVGFNNNAYSWQPLTDDKNALINAINNYPNSPSGGTCVCCAINKAIELVGGGPQQGVSVQMPIPSQSPHPYGFDLEPPGSGTWTINAPPTAANMRLHFTRIQTAQYRWWFGWRGDYLWVTDGDGAHVNMPGWEWNERPNEIDTDTNINNYWSGWGNGSSMTVNIDSDDYKRSGNREWGFYVDKYEYIESGNASEKGKYIIVMTDGITGYDCGNCGGSPGCSGSCTDTNGGPVCGGNPTDCTGPQCDDAIEDAICASCRANKDYGVHVYSVGFGPVSVDCPNANYTLREIAECGNASYYGSSSASELKEIYTGIAEYIVNVTYQSQSMGISGNITRTILYPESYMEFSYTPPANYSSYGEISLTQNTERFNNTDNCTGYIYTSSIAAISDAKVTSYSSEHWTDYVRINEQASPAYNLRDGHFGEDYLLIGDPYIVQIPPSLIVPGENNSIYLDTGDSPYPPYSGCSKDNRAIYTLRLAGRVSYGNVFSEKNGCLWTIEFEDNTNLTENIPDDYNGTKQCMYSQGNISYDANDAVDDSIYRLLQRLDSNVNDKIDIKFDSDMIEFDFSRAGGVRSLWGPIVIKLIVWI
ncbi:MAG: VWA domain-containing protein [Candidatus Altiarchaeota archaeon]|nr:VWA domain-containing protein [Candidatus Altiarchaeota archaeon]